jgi:hypothetical protein
MEVLGFGPTGMAWNGGSWFWPDSNGLEWRKSVLAPKNFVAPGQNKPNSVRPHFFRKGNGRKERKKENSEGFYRPGGDFVAPGKKRFL